jgi:hypothetical protein
MAEWCEVQTELSRVTGVFFDKWPDAWTVYCGRDKHPEWPALDLGEKLHVIFYYMEDLIGDVREIEGQDFVGDRLALEHLLAHVRCHVACGPGYRKRCGCCDSTWEAPAGGGYVADYREAKAITTPAVLDQLAQRIARAREINVGMVVRQMYAPPREADAATACEV